MASRLQTHPPHRATCMILAMVLTMILLGGCSAQQPSASGSQAGAPKAAPAKTGGTLTVAISTEVATLEPHVDNTIQTTSMREPLYDTLVRFNEKGKPEASLATSWQVSPDVRSWTFKLRQDVKFHDGSPFNAAAVKANFERLLDPNRQSPAKNVLRDIAGVEVVDEYTIRFTTREPFAPLLYHLAAGAGAILSPEAVKKWGKDVGLNPSGTGPFKFVEWVKGDRLIYERNPDYWERDKIKLDKIVFRFATDPSTRIAQLEAGEVDIAENPPLQDIERLSSNKNINILRREGARTYFYWMNSSKPPFNNRLVRQALNYGLDKETMMKTIMRGLASGPATNHMAAASSHWVQGKAYEYNPDRAKQLLAEAGYPNGFETSLWTTGGAYPLDKEVAQAVADQLAKIGVKVRLRISPDLVSYLDSLKSPDMEMAFILLASGAVDSNYMATLTLTSTNAGAPFNYSRIKDARVDDLVVKARSTVNDSERTAYYQEIQKILDDEAYHLLLFYLTTVTGERSNVDGVFVVPNEYLIVRYASKR